MWVHLVHFVPNIIEHWKYWFFLAINAFNIHQKFTKTANFWHPNCIEFFIMTECSTCGPYYFKNKQEIHFRHTNQYPTQSVKIQYLIFNFEKWYCVYIWSTLNPFLIESASCFTNDGLHYALDINFKCNIFTSEIHISECVVCKSQSICLRHDILSNPAWSFTRSDLWFLPMQLAFHNILHHCTLHITWFIY